MRDEIKKDPRNQGADVKGQIVSFDDMAVITKGKAGIVINPFSDNFVIPPTVVTHMKRHKEEILSHKHQIAAGTTITTGEPADYPTEMVEAIKKYAKTNQDIQAMWLKLMAENTQLSYLLIVDFRGEPNAVFRSIAEVAQPYLKGKQIDTISLAPFADAFGQKHAAGKPFYKRKWGLFG